jgi:hypothetical protein
LVLATDFAQHIELLALFKSKIAAGGFDRQRVEDRRLLMQIALKCADISHTAKAKQLHLEWTSRITEEFFRQGDQERQLNLEVSPGMDRETFDMPKSQQGFLSFLAKPLFETFAEQFEGASVMVQGLENNLAHWREQDSKN